jgi:drug/metabolite transporter (DMT)-like permease
VGRVYLKLVLAAVFWGATWAVGRSVVQEVPPFAAAFYRFVIAVGVMLAWLAHAEGRWPRLRGRDWLKLSALGFTGVFLYNTFFLHGLQHIDAGRAALVVALSPVLIALLSAALGQERLGRVKSAGIALALLGSVWVIGRGEPAMLLRAGIGLGEWLILGCVAAWTFYTFVGRSATTTLSPLAANAMACGVGCLLLGAAASVQGQLAWPTAYSPKAWACLAFLGVFGTALSYIWYTEGVRALGAAKAAVFINLVPLSGVLSATLFLQERLPPTVLVGGAVTLAGVLMTTWAGALKTAAPAPPDLKA